MPMFDPTRDQARRFFFDTWAKHAARTPLTDLEATALDIILWHPEYHELLSRPDVYVDKDYPPELGETNPFLHLSLHLAIAEQLAIDQPPGIKAVYRQLLALTTDPHQTHHQVMDCLAETIWQAQRLNGAPDGALYLDCLAAKAGSRPKA